MEYIKGIVKKNKNKFNKVSNIDRNFDHDNMLIQIAIPKKKDSLNNNEEVLIIPSEYMNDAENYFYILTSLEMYNYLNHEDNLELQSENEAKSTIISSYKKETDDLRSKLSSLRKELNYEKNKIKGKEASFAEKSSKDADKNHTHNFYNQHSIKNNNLSPQFDSCSNFNRYSNIIEIVKLEEDKKFLQEEVINSQAIIKQIKTEDYENLLKSQEMYEDLLKNNEKLQKEINSYKKKLYYYKKLTKRLKNFIFNSM